jgi:CRISPR-associated protein Csb2
MTVLGIHYLTGCAVATDRTLSGQPEFPPHFGRVFMAMAATYFETRGNDDERAALEWLEAAGAPSIQAGRGHPRSNVKTYVPVNDEKYALPVLRTRQPRSFPTTRLDDPFVYLKWTSAIPKRLRSALEGLCSKVTRIGHSTSLVQMWVAEEVGSAGVEWQPTDEFSGLRMRVAEPGTLKYLEWAFNEGALQEDGPLADALEVAIVGQKHQIEQRVARRSPGGPPTAVRPRLTRWQGYATVSGPREENAVQYGPFNSDIIVLRRNHEDGQKPFGLESTLQLTSALRDAAMKAVGQNVPEWLSGHQWDGKPSLKDHAAFFPLPFVGADHGDGQILGLAITVPREIDTLDETKEASFRRVLGPLLFLDNGEERTIRLWRNERGKPIWECQFRRETRTYPPVEMRASTWTGPATEWASVTPVVLHHYPKRGRKSEVERILLQAFESARLPRPTELSVQAVSHFAGVGHARSMPEFSDGGEKLCRYQVHIRARFPTPVQGPVLVGRGRFRGYGLLRPTKAQHG